MLYFDLFCIPIIVMPFLSVLVLFQRHWNTKNETIGVLWSDYNGLRLLSLLPSLTTHPTNTVYNFLLSDLFRQYL